MIQICRLKSITLSERNRQLVPQYDSTLNKCISKCSHPKWAFKTLVQLLCGTSAKLVYKYRLFHRIEDGIALFFVVSLFKPIWWWWKNIGHFLLKFWLTFLKHFWLFVYTMYDHNPHPPTPSFPLPTWILRRRNDFLWWRWIKPFYNQRLYN